LPSKEQIPLFESAIGVGFTIAHDGIKYLASLAVTTDGLHLIKDVLRYAHLNKMDKLKARCIENFQHLLQVAERAKNQDAVRWISFEQADALALDGEVLPAMPEEIMERIRRERKARNSS
jgi:hypothetical protein